ncbi:MAG: hypothetical protein NTZ05_00265 [Chloroflexi bacterium]|nr:hypothetical protein [Chloroflexota bacterium]
MQPLGIIHCRTCGEPLRQVGKTGWVHPEGNRMMVRCGRCGHTAATATLPAYCPQCGERKEWRRDHAAWPDNGS